MTPPPQTVVRPGNRSVASFTNGPPRDHSRWHRHGNGLRYSRNILIGRSVDRTGRRFRRCSAPVHHRHRPRRKVVGGTAKVRIEALQAELAKLEAVAGGYRADFERERDRARPAHGGALRATADLMAARETAARLEGELTAMRVVEGELALRARPATSTVAAVPLRRPWWRRL